MIVASVTSPYRLQAISNDHACLLRCDYGIMYTTSRNSYRITAVKEIIFERFARHYRDVIMRAMASQITSFTIVYSTVYSGADQRKHQSSASLAFVRGIHRWPVTGEFPAQMASNAENVSIWWRHHGLAGQPLARGWQVSNPSISLLFWVHLLAAITLYVHMVHNLCGTARHKATAAHVFVDIGSAIWQQATC